METLTYKMKRFACYAFLAALMVNVKVCKAQEELVPDQNPNYKKSMEKYMANKEELLKNQGTTVQATYKAIDDMQIKQERKDLRRSYRQERRLARINNRGYFFNSPYYSYNYMNPFGYGYNSSYYTPYNYYRPSCGLNTIANTALLGLGLYWWLR